MKATLSTGVEFEVERKIVASPFGRFHDHVTGRRYDILVMDVKSDPSIVSPVLKAYPDFVGERRQTNDEKIELGIVIDRIRGRTLSRLAAINGISAAHFARAFELLGAAARIHSDALERLEFGGQVVHIERAPAEVVTDEFGRPLAAFWRRFWPRSFGRRL